MITWSESLGHLVGCDEGANGNSSRKTFGKRYNIRLYSVLLIRKKCSRTAHAALNFIEYETSIIFITESPDFLVIVIRRYIYTAFSLYGFQHYRAGFFTHELFKSIYISEIHVIKAFNQWSIALVVMRLTCSRQRCIGSSVKTHICRDNLNLFRIFVPCVFAGKLYCTLICLSS